MIVPSWRATKDVTIPEDLVEEVARLQDYNTFPLQPIADRERTAQPDKILDLEA